MATKLQALYRQLYTAKSNIKKLQLSISTKQAKLDQHRTILEQHEQEYNTLRRDFEASSHPSPRHKNLRQLHAALRLSYEEYDTLRQSLSRSRVALECAIEDEARPILEIARLERKLGIPKGQWYETHEARRQEQAREEEERRGQERGPTPPFHARRWGTTAAMSTIRWQEIPAWRAFTSQAFADYSTLTSFPHPPATSCSQTCKAQRGDRGLEACSCNLRAMFKKLRDEGLDLRTERYRWHPDRFERCCIGDEQRRGRMKRYASEVFAVVEGLWKEEAEGREG